MTTKIKVTLEEFTGYPVQVQVQVVSHGVPTPERDLLTQKGESCEFYVHQNQDIVVGEIKTDAA